jgi:hypothetical protein
MYWFATALALEDTVLPFHMSNIVAIEPEIGFHVAPQLFFCFHPIGRHPEFLIYCTDCGTQSFVEGPAHIRCKGHKDTLIEPGKVNVTTDHQGLKCSTPTNSKAEEVIRQ